MPNDHVPQDQDRARRQWPDTIPPHYMTNFGLATTLALALAALVLGQAVGLSAVAAAGRSLTAGAPDGTAEAVFILASMPVQVITLVLAARMTDENLFAYLGLNLPTRREIAIGAAGLAFLIVAGDVVTFVSGGAIVPGYAIATHRTALDHGTLLVLWFALVVLLPVGEELLLRGFLFRGFVRNARTALPGVIVIALIWTLIYPQDDWVSTVLLFAVGFYLGVIRLVSGSTTLVIVLHMLWNLESILETAVALGWM